MKWHDCKTDPPKSDGDYILWYKDGRESNWEVVPYLNDKWYMNWYSGLTFKDFNLKPYMWAEFDIGNKTIRWQEGTPTKDDIFLIWVKKKNSRRKGYIDLGFYDKEMEAGWEECGTSNRFGQYSLEDYYVYKWAEVNLNENEE